MDSFDVEAVTALAERGASGAQWFIYAKTFGISTLVFGFAVFAVMAFLVYRGFRPQTVLKICALPLVVISAIFLIVVGYSQEQISPVLSLLSAIAGYLLGNQESWALDQPQPSIGQK